MKSTAAPAKPTTNKSIARARAASTGRMGSSKVKKSEYGRQYQQYDLETQAAQRQQQYKPRHSLGQIARLQGDGSEEEAWRSVQQDDFAARDFGAYDDEMGVAGKATGSTGTMRQTLNTDRGWQQMDLLEEKENMLNAAAGTSLRRCESHISILSYFTPLRFLTNCLFVSQILDFHRASPGGRRPILVRPADFRLSSRGSSIGNR